MMSSEKKETDYEEILKEFIKRGAISKNLNRASDTSYSELMSSLSTYYTEKNKHDYNDAINNQYHITISNHIKMGNSICQNILEEKLTSLQKLQTEIENKKSETIKEFCNKSEEIYGNLQKLEVKFDKETMKKTITNCLENRRFCEETVPKLQNEIENMKEIMKRLEPCEIANIDKITKLIQKESVYHLGEPGKIQNRLSSIREKNKSLIQKCTI